MTRRTHSLGYSLGFSLIEALVALAVVAVGLLGLGTAEVMIGRNADVAKQRTEATRLAQEKMELLRAFTTIAPAAGQLSWNGLTAGSDTLTTNASYVRTWTLGGASTDTLRRVTVDVTWTDRAGDVQSVTLNSVISRTDPSDVGLLGFPLPQNTTLKRPKNRNLNIPVPALDLGNGKSVYQLANNFAVVFSNDSGYVVMRCTFVVTNASQLSACTAYSAYIVAGYVSLDGTTAFPAGLGINTAQYTGTSSVSCTVGDAINQNTSTAIAGYKYYLCVVALPQGTTWSGSTRLAGMASGTNYLVCRYQYPPAAGVSANARNVEPYDQVNESLDNQNFVITTANSCPATGGLTSTLHQDCRNSNANRATACPAT